MQPEKKDATKIAEEAHQISKGLAFCVATVVGKYASYPQIDEVTFERIHQKIVAGLLFHKKRRLGDFCQELRAVIPRPVAELLKPERVVDANGNHEELDETELRLIAIADVVRRSAGLSNTMFRELITGLLSWDPSDRLVILNTLTNIVRGS